MYSEQLEQLIKSVIADGVITEKERAVLHKKAASEGVDEDEIDVYVDGLVAQMKPSLKSEPNIDMRFINKSIINYDNWNENYTYYLGNNYFKIPFHGSGKLHEGYLIFFKEEHSFRDNYKNNSKKVHLGISILCLHNFKYFWEGEKRLTFKTSTNSLDLEDDENTKFATPTDFISKKHETKILSYYIDEELLKMLCDAERISFTFARGDTVLMDNISINSFITYAQVFYRSIIDNNAYQDAVIKQDELVSDDNQDKTETDADSETLKVLTIPKKVMNKVALGHKYFEQFVIKNSDLQFIEFDDKHSLSSFNSYIKVFSILKDEKPQFFLKVVYNYYEEKKKRKGEVEQEKKVMNLNAGSMKIVCDGYTEVNLSPLAKSKAIFDKDSEMNFYPISEQDLRTILEAENVSINLYGKKLKAEDIKHVGFSSKLPFVWNQALATLMGEEIPEKKTLFGKIKGLFK